MKKIIALFVLLLLSACGSEQNSEDLVHSIMSNDYKNSDKTTVLFTVNMRHTPKEHKYRVDTNVPLVGIVPSAKLCIGYENRRGNDGYINCNQNIYLDYTQADQRKIYAYETDEPYIAIDGLQYMFPQKDGAVYNFDRSFLNYLKQSSIQNNRLGEKIYIGHFDINFIYSTQHNVNIAHVNLVDDYDNFVKTISRNNAFSPNIRNAFKADLLQGKQFILRKTTLSIKRERRVDPFNR